MSFADLERQALCLHLHRSKEVVFGQKTGDSICNDCGEIFVPNEKVAPPEYRNAMIVSAHALVIAMRVNGNLKLVRNFRTNWGDVYNWALVDEGNNIALPVLSDVASSATLAGYVVV